MNYLIYSFLFIFSLTAFALDRGQYKVGEHFQYIQYEEMIDNGDGTFTYYNPSLKTEFGALGFLAYPFEICQTLGHMGAIPEDLEFTFDPDKKALYLYTTIRSDGLSSIDPVKDISVSFEIKKTDTINRAYFQKAKKVRCSDLKSIY